MMEINLYKVNKNYGFKNLLNNFDLEIKTNEKVALIGSNGCGKTTILKLIAGLENPDLGEVFIRKGATIGFLTQLTNYNDELVKDILYQGLEKELALKDKLSLYESKLSLVSGKKLDQVINSYTKLQEGFASIGGYELDTKISKIMRAFNIDNNMLERKMSSLSGGEKTMVTFASIILSNPDILLLDEPTNYLDIERIEWLEKYLQNYNGTVIIVSHDRYFIDKIVNKTVLIESGKGEVFHGNYSYFLEGNEHRITLEFKAYNNQQKQIDAMKRKIKQLKAWGRQAAPVGEGFFKRAASIEKRLEKIEKLDKPLKKDVIPLSFKVGNKIGKDVLVIKNFSVSFNEKSILNNVSINVQYGEKICLMGNNGSGKTTIIKEIINNKSDSIKLGTGVIIGYVPQSLSFENEELSVIEEAKKYFNGLEQHLRAALCKFLFYEDNVFKKLKNLSGGERVRIKLFCLIQSNCNLLIMDEPTNHLDVDTKEILESALEDFEGTVLFVSHDRYFINKVAKKIFNIENKKIVTYHGDYDYYKEKISDYHDNVL